MKSLIIASVAALAIAAPSASFAGETSVAYNIGATSDYIWRGVSQSDTKPAVFGGADLTSGTLYAGAWASTVDFGGANSELDLYAGWKPVVGAVTFDLGLISYLYPNATANNFVEYKAGASISVGKVGLSLTDYYSEDLGTNYIELGATAPLGDLKIGPFALSATGAFGTQSSLAGRGAAKYDNYKLAITGATEKGLALEVGFTDTNIKKAAAGTGYKYVDPSAYVTLKKSF